MAPFAATEYSAPHVSPLVLSDHLLTLAQDADRAGLREAANKLVYMAHEIFEVAGNA